MLRRGSAFTAAVIVAAVVSIATATGPAGAGGCPVINPDDAADGYYDLSGGGTLGVDVFNTTGADQTEIRIAAPGQVVDGYFKYLNTAPTTETIVVRATVRGDVEDFRVKFLDPNFSRDWTSKLLRPQGRPFRDIGGGGNFVTENIRIRVKKLAGAGPDSSLRIKVTGSFGTASDCGDTLGFRVLEPL